MFSTICGFVYSFVTCPQLNSKSKCPNLENVKIEQTMLLLINSFALLFTNGIGLATVKFPDPFGILFEIAFVTFMNSIGGIIFICFRKRSYQGRSTSPMVIYVVSCFIQWLYVFPYQIYKAKNNEQKKMKLVDVMQTKSGLKLFTLFLEKEQNDENIRFYLEAEEFETNFRPDTETFLQAKLICHRYINVNAKHEVNISDKSRKQPFERSAKNIFKE